MQVEEYLEKSTREERQGLAFEGVPDADLFFVDKVLQIPSTWLLLLTVHLLRSWRCFMRSA